MKYLVLIYEFLKTGLFSVGGGLATLPFLSRMGERYGWFTQNELANMLAVSESTPGPIGINMATYVGNTSGGVLGGCIATMSLVLPSYLVIMIVYRLLSRFRNNSYVDSTMQLLRPASLGMVAAAVWGVLQSVLLDVNALHLMQWGKTLILPNIVLFVVLLAVYLRHQKLHPVVILAIGAFVGIVFQL